MKPNIVNSAVILAAGNSSRIGIPKFTLSFNENETFLEHIIKGYQEFGCSKIILVLNPEGMNILNKSFAHLKNGIHLAVNRSPELGRFLSLKHGLENCLSDSHVFIHNIDNPFINKTLLDNLSENLNGFDYAYPVHNGKGGHPLLLSERVTKEIIQEPSNEINLSKFLKKFKSCHIPFDDDRILLNINSRLDYIEFIKNKEKL